MATFFGEIVPVTSRAVDDEDDDEDLPDSRISPCVVRWAPAVKKAIDKNEKISCETLLVTIGTAAAGFVDTYIMQQKTEIIGTVASGMRDDDVNTLSQMAPTDKSCFIHRLTAAPEVLICQCKIKVSAEQAYSWVDQFFPCLDLESANVIVLISEVSGNYKSEVSHSDLNTPFLRALKTQWFHDIPACPYLETPNTITGLAAQVMTYCQLHQVAAVVYSVYADSHYLDVGTIKAFTPLAEISPVKEVTVSSPKVGELLEKFVEQHQEQNPLYI